MAQLVKRLTMAQVTISPFVSSRPASGCVLTAQSLEPASDSVSPSLFAPTPLVLCLSLSLSKMNKHFLKNLQSVQYGVVSKLQWENHTVQTILCGAMPSEEENQTPLRNISWYVTGP